MSPKSSKPSKSKTKPAPQRVPAHPDSMPPLSVGVPRACELVGIGTTKLYEHIGKGEIETYKDGRKTLIVYESLAKFVETRRAAR
jgi:excisionase family DNA binding protein